MNLAQLTAVIKEEQQVIEVSETRPCQIGRDVFSNLRLDSEKVSRTHAMVKGTPAGKFLLYDLGSRNGTILNGRRVTSAAELKPGDVISIGGFEIRFDSSSSHESGVQPASPISDTRYEVHVDEITVLVIDLRDFTGLSLALGEVKLAELVASFNREISRHFQSSGPWSLKFIGDAVMAIWVHRPGEDRLAVLMQALEAFLGAQSLLDKLGKKFEISQTLRVGAGVNCGIASVGNLGSKIAADYTALGDVVNKAFRLERVTRAFDADLAFGNEVRECIASAPGLTLSGRLEKAYLKGHATPTEVSLLTIDEVKELVSSRQRDSPAEPAR